MINMNIQEYLKQIRIDVIKNTVFINNKSFEFCYTPANDVVKDEFKDEYRYFGGLQCEFEPDSKDYITLENKLCDIAEDVLLTINKGKNQSAVIKAIAARKALLLEQRLNQQE